MNRYVTRTRLHAFAVVFILATWLPSCAHMKKARPFVKTINDAADTLCRLFATENEEQLGMSPADFCAVKENLDPFIDAALAAKQAAGVQAVRHGASE